MIKKSYNLEALTLALERDSAILLNTYDKVTKRTRIYFKCHCGEEYNKNCEEIISKAGAFCKKCTSLRGIQKLHKTLEQDKQLICNLSLLNDIINRDKAILLKQYDIITKDLLIKFKCNCGEESEKKCIQLIKVSGAFCKKCTRNITTTKIKTKLIQKYNIDNLDEAQTIKYKRIQYNLKKYGVENVFQSPEIKEKIKQSCFKKYNVEYASQSLDFREKVKKTCNTKYNVDNPMQCSEVKEKIKQTTINKYNVEHTLKLPEIREKIKQTFIQKYNVDNPNKTLEIREKIRQTCLKKYNTNCPAQCQEVQERLQKNAKKYKEYKMPSGEIRKVQGYEPFALDEVVKIYEESDIITDRKCIPRISYKIEDKQKYYFPDIYIKSQNKIIEVKSTWTYKCKEDNIQEKANATKLTGYDYEIWVYDNKGNKTVI
jgi:hypothetical protein